VSSGNAGNGGDIVLSAIKGNILGAGSSSIYSFSVANSPNSTSGDGGNITLEAKNLINNIELVTFSSSGNAGKATINGFEDLTISRLQISTSKTVSIPNPVSDRGRPITFDFGTSGSSGDVTVTGLGSLTFDNTIINSTTQSINPAGNISITSPSLINFQNNSQIKSSTNSTGNAGNISFTAPILNITGGSQVLAETNGDGAGGNIDINASNIINLKRILDSSPVLSVQTSNGGKAGTIVINTPTLNLSDQARITATATATSTNTDGGGSVTLNASTMNLSGTVGVFAETESSANAGTLKLNPYLNDPNLLVTLTTGSQISASTSAQGNGGDLILKAPNSITLSGQGTLAVEAKQGSTGNAGNISFTTGNLLLTDGVTVSASTAGSGKAGDISVKVNDFTISNGASIETKTSSSGDSGKIEVIVGNNLILVGAGTGFFADTTAESTGKGGSIFIDPPLVSITNGAGISVNSLGKGNGGNIDIFADKFIFDNNAFLRANTASGEGGNINLQIANIFFPRNNSSITATAAGTGNGGNITLSALFLVSLPSENNDIFANAFLGKGGNINITTQGIFGLAFRPRLTPLSDITASSDFGVQGNVNLNTPGVDPSQGLNNLPADINDASKLVSQKCLADRQGSSFVITGRGGVPASPFDTISAANIPDHLGSISNQTARSTSNRITAESSNLPVPDRIVEAQGWTINAQGQVSLIATAIATPAQVWSHQTNCISASK
jgi:large exoprotein involved in heme utilization and adhesion